MHRGRPGRTLFILEQRWGNDGYAFWFKLLELLTTSEGHFYDLGDLRNREFFNARMNLFRGENGVSGGISGENILDLLSDLGKIDKDLWVKRRVIWCQSLVNKLAETLYKKRNHAPPVKPSTDGNIISPEMSPQTNNLPGNEKNGTENGIISPEITRREVSKKEEGGRESPPSSPSAPEDEPKEKPTVLTALRKVDASLSLTPEDEHDLAGLIVRESLDTITAVFRGWRKKYPDKAFHWFVHDFDALKPRFSGKAPPAAATPSSPSFDPDREREQIHAEEADPAKRREKDLAIARSREKMHLPLTDEQRRLLNEEDELEDVAIAADSGAEQDDIPFPVEGEAG